MKRFRLIGPAVVGLLLVGGGCTKQDGQGPPLSTSPASAAASAQPTLTSSSPAATPEPSTPSPEPSLSVSFTCRDADFTEHSYDSYREAWPDKPESCDAEAMGDMSDKEYAAFERAYGPTETDYDSIKYLYALCATNSETAFADNPWTQGQIDEQTGAFMLCPDHPMKASITKSMNEAAASAKAVKAEEKLREKELADGSRFTDGTYRVGKELKPGRYYAVDVDGCYWERQDRRGEIIDNNFVTAAKRVEVKVRSTDYGFTSRGCGDWRVVK